MQIELLKNRKKALGLSVTELAVLADLPVGTVSKIFTGETQNPRPLTIEKLDLALAKEESKRRIEAYLLAMRDYFMSNPESFDTPNEFEPIYRRIHNLENKPIAWANSLTEKYPIWNNTARKKEILTTSSEFLHMATENRWVELMKGNIIINETPGLEHQLMVKQINKQIETFIDENHGSCKAFDMGINVKLDEKEDTILIPDILVLCDESKLQPFGVLGAPDWVIEVISPSTRQYDFKQKTFQYMQYGVRELWLVDLKKRIVVVYENEEYLITRIYPFEEPIPVGIYEGELKIQLK